MTRPRLARSLWVVSAMLIILYVLGVVGRTIGILGFGAGLIGCIVAWDPHAGSDAPAAETVRPRTMRRTPGPAPPLPQAAAIPFRRADGQLEICLIRKWTLPWGIPKGRVEPGETPEQTALRETLEEAGIRGRLIGASIGTYEYKRRGIPCVVDVFLLEVLEERGVWLEAAHRERRWVTLAEATELLSQHPGRSLLGRAADMLGADASA